jgi:uncharacterized SAM-binding protein YcdF (DUF218 family)
LTAFDFHVLLRTLVLPPSSTLLLALAGLLFWPRRPRLGAALCAAGILSLWLLAAPVVADALARAAEGYPPLDPSHLTAAQARAQAIVILGGGVRLDAPEAGGDAPGVHTSLRLIEGAKIARATHLPVLVSGNDREAFAMRRFLEEDMQVPVRWTEAASHDTHENAVFSARLLRQQGIEQIILVTSSAHLTRAAAEFRAAGLEVEAAPAEMWTWDERGALALVPSVLALERSRTALYEWAGRMVR